MALIVRKAACPRCAWGAVTVDTNPGRRDAGQDLLKLFCEHSVECHGISEDEAKIDFERVSVAPSGGEDD